MGSEPSWSARAWSCSLWDSLIAAATSLRNASVVASSSRTYKRSGLVKKAPLPDQNVQGACLTDENDGGRAARASRRRTHPPCWGLDRLPWMTSRPRGLAPLSYSVSMLVIGTRGALPSSPTAR